MFDKIIAYSIKQKFIIGLMVVGLIIVGSYSLTNLPIDALPDITNNQVQIITTSPNLATQEVELFITYPIELAVKSIPDIVELRSVSRFGLSLVTVVFKENTDIYWARNQISERLKEAEENIPEGFGTPELAPISTGLGEIFQYTVTAKEGFEEEFDIMELRSIQDWIIVPQILGTKGVAEVNTLGGVKKEYEVAVNPGKLKSMGITMAQIFESLQRNNENTGGAYIDKKPNAYFIRSVGMVSSLDDVSKIVVAVKNDIPVLIRDVADVQYGSSIRYGATTRNGNGEVVNGMVMMLKGANSAQIVSLVKEKITQIEKTLPEGVSINPYLDRTKLVNKAIYTVKKNLIEGALIVIFILVLLIGNWRAGLIVASVIPLALLFAVSMMRLFGVSGNLMSLGAIDFGLIVDGAVIIVEAIVHRLQVKPAGNQLTTAQMDDVVYQAASGIRKSAAFGEIIILIVYLPILALVGIEGKTFAPMAQTVAFAILGAFILSLTYVPMMTALCLSKKTGHKKNISDKIIAAIQSVYTPILNASLRIKGIVLAVSLALFIGSIFLFKSLGGEFIPTLSEGDIATHVMIPPGSSLEQEIATTTKAEKLLLANFPEIEQVVSKIGSAEVPTDPMPMEVADVMIIMKDKKEWTSASNKEEMFEKMEKVLDDLPGVTTEFTQPIQMRFNELMTGVRSDVGVKIFGEDIDLLVALGDQAVSIIQSVEGVEDARAESVAGLPQINIKFNKDKLALYGLNVSDLNQAVSMGFAGSNAGVVYEGEKKFDLVVRLAKPFRQDISNIENLYVSLSSGNQIPLGQVADIRLERGPAQISREDGKRRIIVGFNVRGRDVESVVDEIEQKFAQQMDLPSGYFINYAGQFENLKRAKARLGIAVPLALALIFVLLYFTFNSVIQSILIFTAIPLSAIGGVLALWLRGMPFSISAGIGFIALFGVAVLNGIVLIGYFNQLKKEGMTDILERIKVGTSVRLRPVIMTASVASLGFLPMALSHSAGAEVQKPLATVVIGGLITATLLTLIVLPILYYYSEKFKSVKISKQISLIVLAFFCVIGVQAQTVSEPITTIDKAIDVALNSNGNVEAYRLNIERTTQLKSGVYIMPKTEFQAELGQLNGSVFDQSLSVSQTFNPFLAKAGKAMAAVEMNKATVDLELAKREIKYQIREIWEEWMFNQTQLNLLEKQQELFNQFAAYADKKYQFGESNWLEKTTAETKAKMLAQKKNQLIAQQKLSITQLKSITNSSDSIAPTFEAYEPLVWDNLSDTSVINKHPLLVAALEDVALAEAKGNLYSAERKPEFKAGYAVQSFNGAPTSNGEVFNNAIPRFHAGNVGINVSIFGKGYKSKIKASETEALMQTAKAEQLKQDLLGQLTNLVNQYYVQKENLLYYSETALPNAELIGKNAQITYEGGDIGYLEYMQALETKYELEQAHLEAIKNYNHSVHALMYLLNQ